VRAAVAVRLVEKRPFYVETSDEARRERVLLAKPDDRVQATAHGLDVVRDDRQEECLDPVRFEPHACLMQFRRR
jgi:hypothetical protein